MGKTKAKSVLEPKVLKGRRTGAKTYDRVILFNIVKKVLPACSYDWQRVAEEYKVNAEEETVRNWEDIKKQFIQKMAFNGRNPPANGKSSDGEFIMDCQNIYASILRKEETKDVGNYDYDDSEEEVHEYDEDYDPLGEQNEEDVSNFLKFLSSYDI